MHGKVERVLIPPCIRHDDDTGERFNVGKVGPAQTLDIAHELARGASKLSVYRNLCAPGRWEEPRDWVLSERLATRPG
jgi:hypothetical protein